MSTDKGYIKLYRDIRYHIIWKGEPFSRNAAWIDLILRASHEDKDIILDGKKRTICRGTFVTSQKKLAADWGWGRTKTHEFLDLLKNEGMITYTADTKKTVINIVNYSVYQDSRKKRAASDGTTNEATDGATNETTDRAFQRHQTGHNQDTIEGTKKKEKETILEPDDELDLEGWEPL